MARKSKTDELADVISPLAMDVLAYLNEIGAPLTMAQTIALLQRFQSKAEELTAAAGQEVRNGHQAV